MKESLRQYNVGFEVQRILASVITALYTNAAMAYSPRSCKGYRAEISIGLTKLRLMGKTQSIPGFSHLDLEVETNLKIAAHSLHMLPTYRHHIGSERGPRVHSNFVSSSFLRSNPPLSSARAAPSPSSNHGSQRKPLSAHQGVKAKPFPADDATSHLKVHCPDSSGNESLSPPLSYRIPPAINPALPDSHSSPGSPQRPQPLVFDDVKAKLKPFLERRSMAPEMSIEGVTSDVVERLRELSRAGELPGWENLRYVRSQARLTCAESTAVVSQNQIFRRKAYRAIPIAGS